MTVGCQTTRSEITPAANEGDTVTPGQPGVAAPDRAFPIPFAFCPDGYTLTLAELAVRTGLRKSTVLRLADSLIQRRMLFCLEDGRYQIGAAPLMLGTPYQRSMRLGDVVLSHMRALAEAAGEAMSLCIHERDVRACLHRVDSNHSIRDHMREDDVLPLECDSGGRVLYVFSGIQDAMYDAIWCDRHHVSIDGCDWGTMGPSVPVSGVQQALRGALYLASPASRIDGALL